MNNRIKQKKVMNEDMASIRNLLIILLVVVLIVVGLYFLTNKLLEKDSNSNVSETVNEVEIDYDICTVGTMFNRVEDEYYVLMYSSETDGNELDSVLDSYRSSDNYIKTYYVNLDLKVNSNVLGDTLVKNPNDSSSVKVKGATLFKLKNGKCVNTYSGVETIVNILK